MYFTHACIAINALVNIIFWGNKSINWMLLQTTKGIPPPTIYLGWWDFWIEPYKPERRKYHATKKLPSFIVLQVASSFHSTCKRQLKQNKWPLMLPYFINRHACNQTICAHHFLARFHCFISRCVTINPSHSVDLPRIKQSHEYNTEIC